jgi:Na+-translocating ferredoxin:NAD+ oxidoreductase subunit E
MTGGKTLAGEGATLVMLLALCPAAAASARLVDALWMALGVVLVLVLSSLAVALVAKASAAPDGAAPAAAPGPAGRWLGALVISSFLAASFEVVLAAFAPEAAASMGIYAPLIAVNCLVLTRMEAAGKGGSMAATLRVAAGKGGLFAAALLATGLVREVLGAGTITFFPVGAFPGTVVIPSLADNPARALALSGGALLCLGYLAAALKLIGRRRAAASPAPRAPGGGGA